MIETSQSRRLLAVAVVVATAVAVLVSTAAPVTVGAAQESPPAVPAAYYGNVTIGGEPADPGTEIVAVIDGEEVGSITVEKAGQYGGPAAEDEKLFVPEDGEREIEPGAEVTFEIEGAKATTDPQTVKWESGALDRVDLQVDESQVDDGTGDGGAGDGNAGDGGAGDGNAGDGGAGDGGAGAGGGGVGGGTPVGTPEVGGPLGVIPPGEVAGVINVPPDVTPVRAERVEITVDEETGGSVATFSADSIVERITFNTSATGLVTVAQYDEPSDDLAPVPGVSVTVTQIEVPDGMQMAPGTVRLRIPQDRIEDRGVAPEDLQVYRLVDGEWNTVETDVREQEGGPVIVEANVPGFSFFTVSATGEPTAEFEVAPESPRAGEELTLDGSPSTTPYGEIVGWNWSIAGQSLNGEAATVTIEEPGEYEVELTVRNDAGKTDTVMADLTVSEGEPDAGEEDTSEADGEPADQQQSPDGTGADGEPSTGERSGFSPVVLGIVTVLVVVIAALVAARLRSGE